MEILLDKMKQTCAVPERGLINLMLEKSGLCMSVAFISLIVRHTLATLTPVMNSVRVYLAIMD